MGEALKNLGIQTTSLIAQAVNFGILLFVLWKFLYTPVLKMLDERSKKVAESVKNADKMEKALAESEKDREEYLATAKIEADKIIKDARKNAKEIEKTILAEAETKANEIIAAAKAAGENEKTVALNEVKGEVGRLVEEALTSILARDGAKYDDRLIAEGVKEF